MTGDRRVEDAHKSSALSLINGGDDLREVRQRDPAASPAAVAVPMERSVAVTDSSRPRRGLATILTHCAGRKTDRRERRRVESWRGTARIRPAPVSHTGVRIEPSRAEWVADRVCGVVEWALGEAGHQRGAGVRQTALSHEA